MLIVPVDSAASVTFINVHTYACMHGWMCVCMYMCTCAWVTNNTLSFPRDFANITLAQDALLENFRKALLEQLSEKVPATGKPCTTCGLTFRLVGCVSTTSSGRFTFCA